MHLAEGASSGCQLPAVALSEESFFLGSYYYPKRLSRCFFFQNVLTRFIYSKASRKKSPVDRQSLIFSHLTSVFQNQKKSRLNNIGSKCLTISYYGEVTDTDLKIWCSFHLEEIAWKFSGLHCARDQRSCFHLFSINTLL